MIAIPVVYNDVKYNFYKLIQFLPKVPKQMTLIPASTELEWAVEVKVE